MDRRIRVLALFLVACFALLFLQLNNLQVASAPKLLANPDQVAEDAPASPFSEPRGDIVSADGVILAETTPSTDSYGEQRSYPDGKLFADVTGYYDAVDTTETGVEGAYNNVLMQHSSQANTLRQILTEQTGTDNVVLSVRADLQNVARQALGGRLGAIIAIDPRTGAILAMYGNPTYDPNLLAVHNRAAVEKTVQAISGGPDAPLTNQVTDHAYQPGSTMKVITTAAMYDHDPALLTMVWPSIGQTKLPGTSLPLHNFGGEVCGGNLLEILTVSCDTAYALIGVQLGPQNLVAEAESFGFNKQPPIDLNDVYGQPDAIKPTIPPASQIGGLPGNPNAGNSVTGYSAIGQKDDLQTALGNALVAAAIGDGGTIMTPHVMAHVLNPTGGVVSSYQPHAWLQATSATTADAVRTDMLNVALAGTAKGLFPPADNVAAKTGTAETAAGCTDNWLIATGPAGAGQTPRVAVAAVIPAQPGVACNSQETTGATVAGPAVAQLFTAALAATK